MSYASLISKYVIYGWKKTIGQVVLMSIYVSSVMRLIS